ncbi:MAG: outer membrane lipoprotein carrier protein LolA [Myxococcota bacterium]|nr:outer membrane lipoprotein carrier protein LolA [Myxococcota bacterium]
MRSKRAFRTSLATALLALALGATAQESRPQEAEIRQLLSEFTRSAGVEARFVEEKHMALLAAPLVAKGTIYFDPPGSLARHTSAPASSRLLITTDRVTFTDAHGTQVLELGARPVVRSFVESFVTLLRGDFDALDRRYEMALFIPKAAGHWQLTLRPRSGPMARVFDRLVVRGAHRTIEQFVAYERDGDHTVTRFSGVNPARTFSDAERQRLFTVPESTP